MASKKLIVLLALVMIYWGYDTIANANRVYSNSSYWENATLSDVAALPDEVLLPGNEYGSVLMFAALINTQQEVIEALIIRGADVNEVETRFKGTPLSAAAAGNPNPEIINLLVKNGAKVNVILSQGRTPLMNATMQNNNKGIVRALLKNGANTDVKDDRGLTALEYARLSNNTNAINELTE